MKKVLLFLPFLFVDFAFGINCLMLMEKYEAPDPATKTMAQISRWIERKVEDNPSDARELEACLISKAADNPNKDQVAGK